MTAKITLDRALRPKASSKKRGVRVYESESAGASIPGLIDGEREKRLGELKG